MSSGPPGMEGRVLVVDDTEANRYFVTKTLRQVGLEVMEAASGQEALRCAERLPDVVVLDVRLPDMSGFEVCRQLKGNPATAAIPVLYISSMMRDEELEARLFEDGADGYIPQPIEPKHLVAQTWALVRMRRAELQRQRERAEALSGLRRLTSELESKERLLDAVLQQLPVGILLSEAPSGRTLLANGRFEALVGRGTALQDMESFRPDSTRHLDGQPYQREELPLWRALHRGEEVREELVQVLEDGAVRFVWTCAVPVRDARGALVASVLTLEDITERRATQESLRLSEERLRLALEAASIGVWSHDVNSRESTWDARTREMLGLASDAPVDVGGWLANVHPEDRERLRAESLATITGEDGGRLEFEYRIVRPQGGLQRWIAVKGRLHVLAGGRRRLMGTVVDITERKQAEQYAAALQVTTAAFAHSITPQQVAQALVEHGLRAMDAAGGSVCMVVEEALSVLHGMGYPEPLLRQHQGLPLTEPTPMAQVVASGRALWAESPEAFARDWPDRAGFVRASGHQAWLCMPLKEGERVVGTLGLSFTTVRRFSPEEREHLESLCRLGGQALARARLHEETQRLAELEQQFLGMVSHDLRNPLQAISLGARTLQRLERPNPEALLRMTGRIASSADTMGRMVADLLDFTRGRLGGGIPLEKTRGDLVRVCREVMEEFALTHPSRDAVLEGDEACEGWWDGPRMRQVLSNLLSNALRHAREGTEVKVRVRCEGSAVELDVENAGEPIPPELLPVLFEPFRRGHATFRPAGSLGLGLYIVRQVVEGHGGRVRVASGAEGTCFTVRVPRGEPGAARGAGRAEPSGK